MKNIVNIMLKKFEYGLLIIFSLPVLLVFNISINIAKYMIVFGFLIICLILLLLIKNISKYKIMNLASFILIPFYIHLILLNLNYSFKKLNYFNNLIISIINGFISIIYSFLIFIPNNILLIFNISDKIKHSVLILFGTIFINVIIKLIIEIKINVFKNEKEKYIVKLLSYLQSNSYIVLFYITFEFYSNMK